MIRNAAFIGEFLYVTQHGFGSGTLPAGYGNGTWY